MMELLNVYRVQFYKREPILVASSSFSQAIESIMKDSALCPEEGDEIISISLQLQFNVFV